MIGLYLVDFQFNTDWLSKFCIYFTVNHLALLKDRCLKKMLLKIARTVAIFRKTIHTQKYGVNYAPTKKK